MLRTMSRVEVYGLKSSLFPTVQTLQILGCLHVDPLDATAYGIRNLVRDAVTLSEQETLAELLSRVEGQLDILGGATSHTMAPMPPDENLTSHIQDGLNALDLPLQQLLIRKRSLEAELILLPRYKAMMLKLLPLLPENAHKAGYVMTAIFVSRAYASTLDVIARALAQITGELGEAVSHDVDSETRAMVLIFPEENRAEVEQLLGQQDISRVRLPDQLESESFDAVVTHIQGRMQTLTQEIKQIDTEIDKLSDTWRDVLTRWRDALADRVEACQILENFGETDNSFVIVGWIPTEDLDHVRDVLRREVGDTVTLHEVEITPDIEPNVPISLNNPPPVRPFEGLVKLRALPRYGEIDPTALMALFLPMFFGMMLGDIGYGVILLVVCYVLLRRFTTGMQRDLILILAMGAGWSIVFGVLFGELFGTLGEHLGLHAILFDRAHPENVVSLMLLTLAAGAVHQVLGLLLGLWQAYQSRNRTHLLERGGMLLGLMALFVIVAVLVEMLPAALMTPSIAALIVGIVLLSASMGWLGILMGPLEFIGLIGNLLSYLRIAAIGLASVYLALVANEVAGLVGSILVGMIIAVLIHALNIVLGAFSPSIQSLRLQYVEFFRKFYTGGGKPYQPFKRHSV